MLQYKNNKIHFVIDTLHALKYFLPLTIEANKNQIQSKYYIFRNNKWHCASKHIDNLKNLSKEYNFEILDGHHINDVEGNVFCLEGLSVDRINDKKNKKIFSLVEQDEPYYLYKKYINEVDNVIFPNKFFADWFESVSDKNLYLGSPKYDLKYNSIDICKKYKLDSTKKCLIILPKLKDLNPNSNLLSNIYKVLKSCNYFVIGKQRIKDSHSDFKNKCDLYLEEDTSYFFPWITMELISISDFIINFDSSSIEECLMLNKPLINFNVKDNKWPLINNLKNKEFCVNSNEKSFSIDTIKKVTGIDKNIINSIKKEFMFDYNSSEKILEYLYG